MAFQKIAFNDTLPHGRLLRHALASLEQGQEGLVDILAAMILMIDGDGSQVTHFDEVMSRFGFPSTTVAKAAYDELQSVKAKITVDSSVTNVNAALVQAFNKFR